MAKQLAPVPLSELPEVEKPDNFYLFGTEELKDGTLDSRKYKLENLVEYAKKLQFERRISLNMEKSTQTIFIGEEMTIYRAEGYNISELTIDHQTIPIGIDLGNQSLKIAAKSLVEFKIVPQLTDPATYIFVFARAKVPE
ncbi:MAG: hypothetical protein LBV43_05460 [Prevotella sp.]|jgi:hypothetical protein|nr:hypothetical protein [Prevotella sp.]